MIFSEIYKGQVTKNKSLLIDKYTEKKEQYELTAKNMTDKANLAEDRMDSFAAANADTTVTDGDGSGNDAYIIDGVYGNDENYNYNEQTTYDELIENYVNYSITANNNTIDAQYCQNIIDIFSAEPEEGVDSAEYTKSVDEKITETSAELKELYNSTYNAIDDYNQYIAAQHMSFLTGVQYYENINTLVLSLLALILGFGFSVIFAIALEILRKYKKYTASHMRANGISVEYEDEEDEEDAKKKKRRMRFFGIDEDSDNDEPEGDKDDEALDAFSGADDSASVGEAVPKTNEDDLESEAAEINTEIEVPKIDTDDEAFETAAEDDSKGTDTENEAFETAAEDEAEENAAEDEPAEGDTAEQPSDEIIPDTVNYMSEGIDVKNAVISAKKPKKSIFGRIAATIGIVVLAIIVLAAIFTGYIYLDNNRVENVEYTYVSDKVTDAFDGFKIALVTDYHNSDMVDKTVEAIKSGNPDIICIGGDLVDLDTQDFTNALEFVEKLTEIAPVYYEYGNHEIWSNNINETEEPIIKEKLKDLDVIFLNDETVKIEKNGDYFYLTGFEDLKYDDLQSGDVYTSVLEDRMAQLSKNVDEDKLSVLLFHRANYFDTVSKYPFDLVLSGHIHAGQIGIPMLAQKVVDKHLGGSKYIVGEYEENGNSMIVSGGIGETYDIPRILCAPQVVTVTLTKSTAGASESEETEDSASETSTPDASESEITEDSASETSTPDTSE
ncbi:MAG: metallophosphoesterase, partial [Firmicutes bacterium]|nr:metallophosphoesterase [Bacillota bacterium]